MNQELNKGLELIRYVRESILALTGGMSNEQLNEIPDGFNNNVAWNVGHILFTQQMLCYQLGGIRPAVDISLYARFAPGTRPEFLITAKELEKIWGALIGSIEQLEFDLQSGLFAGYAGWNLPSGIAIGSIQDAIMTSLVHEGRHLGVIIALSKIIA
ncbi:DinB family protein [Dyadobacter sp. OTU695]|uniref:DinB family protein n=1 Tax=Dyadobacter sp. OTU695 TaxID=3043860 RepID=UPI00313BEC5C